MLYGNSSLGKTELVREIAEKFFAGKYLEKHLSMFKNNNYADYFFGNLPNRRSIGFDLLERESNLLFLDEMDKCPEHFYSAFYNKDTLGVYLDALKGEIKKWGGKTHRPIDTIYIGGGTPSLFKAESLIKILNIDINNTNNYV